MFDFCYFEEILKEAAMLVYAVYNKNNKRHDFDPDAKPEQIATAPVNNSSCLSKAFFLCADWTQHNKLEADRDCRQKLFQLNQIIDDKTTPTAEAWQAAAALIDDIEKNYPTETAAVGDQLSANIHSEFNEMLPSHPGSQWLDAVFTLAASIRGYDYLLKDVSKASGIPTKNPTLTPGFF
jgi:hypothetical protein